mmetsp:Transcript_36267/g.62830  ORF Transcript_36267/g.62830 Transcript_36267/m.62830 type:complete len:209 (-) Transcript_36267:16-642(-)
MTSWAGPPATSTASENLTSRLPLLLRFNPSILREYRSLFNAHSKWTTTAVQLSRLPRRIASLTSTFAASSEASRARYTRRQASSFEKTSQTPSVATMRKRSFSGDMVLVQMSGIEVTTPGINCLMYMSPIVRDTERPPGYTRSGRCASVGMAAPSEPKPSIDEMLDPKKLPPPPPPPPFSGLDCAPFLPRSCRASNDARDLQIAPPAS